MTFDFGTVSKQNQEIRESPLLWLPGVDSSLSVQVDGEGTVTDASMVLYENGRDVTSTLLTGSISISGRVITTKTFQNLVGGNNYKYYIYFSDDGLRSVLEGTIVCVKLGVKPSTYPGLIDRFRVSESPILIYPNQDYNATIQIDGQGEIDNVTMTAYRKTSIADVLTGTVTVTNRNIGLKTIENLTPGEYIVYVYFTDDGKETVRYLEILCPKLGY